MITGLFHNGSGTGDQIFCYLATRITAERLGVPFEMVGKFKGKDFIKLDYTPYTVNYLLESQSGKITIPDKPLFESTTNYYNPEFHFIEDGTVVDGCTLQDEKYWDLKKVREWLKTEPLEMPDDVCVINLRGGEFRMFPELLLGDDYWGQAINIMQDINPNMKFEVHTDDLEFAKEMFPDYPAIHDVGINWRSVRYAHYSILSNSAFGIIPALLSGAKVICPRYWARPHSKEWSMPSNYYSKFIYI